MKEYLAYKVEGRNANTNTLKLYIMNIKAHNQALGHNWDHRGFRVIIDEALNKCNKDASLQDSNSPISMTTAEICSNGLGSLDPLSFPSSSINTPKADSF
ncbi:11604_t:CDS:1, partial [Scutellospora calospora]